MTVKVGFLGAATGPGAALSRTVENAERLALSQFNSDHPRLDVVVDVQSTNGTAAGSAAAARRLVAAGTIAVIGPQSPAEVRAALPVLSTAGIPALTATATEPDLSASGWMSFFRVVANEQQQGTDAAEELVSGLHLTDLEILAGDAPADRTRSRWAASTATESGAVVSGPSAVTTRAGAAAAARQAVRSGVDGVFFSGRAVVARVLVTELAGEGYEGTVLIASDTPSSVLGPLGKRADGVYLSSPADNPAAAAAGGGSALVFIDAYRAAFGVQPPTWAAEAYDATNAVLAAVGSGAYTGLAIGDYLFSHTSVGVSSVVAFDSFGDLINSPVFVSQIQNGAPVQIATATPPSA